MALCESKKVAVGDLTRALCPSGEFRGAAPIRQKAHSTLRIFPEANQRPDRIGHRHPVLLGLGEHADKSELRNRTGCQCFRLVQAGHPCANAEMMFVPGERLKRRRNGAGTTIWPLLEMTVFMVSQSYYDQWREHGKFRHHGKKGPHCCSQNSQLCAGSTGLSAEPFCSPTGMPIVPSPASSGV